MGRWSLRATRSAYLYSQTTQVPVQYAMNYKLHFIGALVLTGCATGTHVDPESFQRFQEGKTTKAELMAALGAPSTTSMTGSTEILNYQSQHVSASAYIPFANMAGGAVTGQLCNFTFDKAGILRQKTCSSARV